MEKPGAKPVVSTRVEVALRDALKAMAKEERRAVANLVEKILWDAASAWCARKGLPPPGSAEP